MTRLKILRTSLPLACLLWSAVNSPAAIIGYVNNPTGNSADWTLAVNTSGGTTENNINFEGLSVPYSLFNRTLDSYQDAGVTIDIAFSRTSAGAKSAVVTGAGPSGSNTTTGPKSSGEGVRRPSTYLLLNTPRSTSPTTSASTTVTFNFSDPISAFGLRLFDIFDPYGRNPSILSAYDVTGTLLGSFNSLSYNFQKNNLYFMGLADTENLISSVRLTTTNYGIWSYPNATDVYGIDDVVFARVDNEVPVGAVPEPVSMCVWGLLAVVGCTVHWRVQRRLRATAR